MSPDGYRADSDSDYTSLAQNTYWYIVLS